MDSKERNAAPPALTKTILAGLRLACMSNTEAHPIPMPPDEEAKIRRALSWLLKMQAFDHTLPED